MDTKKRTAVVTGACTGIGRAISDRFVADGWRVYSTGRTKCSPTCDRIELDVTSPEQWSALATLITAESGSLDALVNNAGILYEAPVEDTPLDRWNDVITTNLTGAFLGCKSLIPLLRLGDTPAVCNVSSIDALSGSVNHAAYAASKGGLTSLTRALAVELAPAGIRANAICPGTVVTPMTESFLSDEAAAGTPREAKHPLGRLGTVEEQAAAAAFLCSTEASFVTGVSLSVDGGRAIR